MKLVVLFTIFIKSYFKTEEGVEEDLLKMSTNFAHFVFFSSLAKRRKTHINPRNFVNLTWDGNDANLNGDNTSTRKEPKSGLRDF